MSNYDKILRHDYGEMQFGVVPEKRRKRKVSVDSLKGCINEYKSDGKTYYRASVTFNKKKHVHGFKTRQEAEEWRDRLIEELKETYPS